MLMFEVSERSLMITSFLQDCEASQADLSITPLFTCFVGSSSHLMGAHCARVVGIVTFEDLLQDPRWHVTIRPQ